MMRDSGTLSTIELLCLPTNTTASEGDGVGMFSAPITVMSLQRPVLVCVRVWVGVCVCVCVCVRV